MLPVATTPDSSAVAPSMTKINSSPTWRWGGSVAPGSKCARIARRSPALSSQIRFWRTPGPASTHGSSWSAKSSVGGAWPRSVAGAVLPVMMNSTVAPCVVARVWTQPFGRRSYWIPGSYALALSEKPNSFLRPLKKKGFKEKRRTKVGFYAIGTSTTLESNKSLGFLRDLTQDHELAAGQRWPDE